MRLLNTHTARDFQFAVVNPRQKIELLYLEIKIIQQNNNILDNKTISYAR